MCKSSLKNKDSAIIFAGIFLEVLAFILVLTFRRNTDIVMLIVGATPSVIGFLMGFASAQLAYRWNFILFGANVVVLMMGAYLIGIF